MDTPNSLSPSKRPWLQFSLRSLLLLTLMSCIGLALLIHRAKQQRQVIRELEALGVDVRGSELPPSTQWLRGVLEDGLLGVTYSARISNGPTNEQLLKLQQLPGLRSISVEYDGSMAESEIESTMDAIDDKLPGIGTNLSGDHSSGSWFRSRASIGCTF